VWITEVKSAVEPIKKMYSMITFYTHSGVHTLRVAQELPVDRATLWDFLSRPQNLSEITPGDMGFKVTTPFEPGEMYPGQVITYQVSPFRGIRTSWVTEITHVEEGRYFVDEQRFGPYRFWHHKHFIEEEGDGVKMTDEVTYKLPLGFLGRMVNGLLVKRRLRQIFEYRQKVFEDHFGKP
jgi:ligand-binding SRPBCC domain-containing protein